MFAQCYNSMSLTAVTLLVLTIGGQWPEVEGDHPQPVVKIGETTIQGRSVLVEGGRRVSTFLGIRYGKSPVGFRRFMQTTAADLPRGTLDATSYGPRCPQMPLPNSGTKSMFNTADLGMAEDCLFLNVFQPENADRLPVLVFIHGGGFIFGSPDLYEADVLAADAEVVVVVVAYRLGVLGFLSTGDDSAPGNYGLWDQRLALQWVQQYIEHFGGDKGKVTLAGHSAGAVSASLLSLSPKSRDLFHQVIQMSGSAYSPWGRVSPAEALENAKRLGHLLGCSEKPNTTQALIECIREQSFERLVTSGTHMFPKKVALSLVSYTWVPVVDDDLVRDPDEASSFPGPLLTGVTNNEGAMLTSILMSLVAHNVPGAKQLMTQRQSYKRNFLSTLIKQELPDLVPQAYPATDSPYPEAYLETPFANAVNKLECFYFKRQEGSNSTSVVKAEVEEVFGDQAFVVGTVRYLRQFSNFQLSYLYYFNHQTARPGLPLIRHIDELSFMFGYDFSLARTFSDFTGYVREVDRQLARDFRKLLSNFIKTGNPNDKELPDGWPDWKPFTPKGGYYLEVSPQPKILSHLKMGEMTLWIEELPEILKLPSNTTLKQQCTISSGSERLGVRNISGVFVPGLAIVVLCMRMLLS